MPWPIEFQLPLYEITTVITIDNTQSIQNGNGNNEKSFSNKMRKFVSNGNQNSNTKAPVSRRKKRSDSSENSQQSSGVSRSSSEPALNQPQEAFVREAPSMTSLNKNKGNIFLLEANHS